MIKKCETRSPNIVNENASILWQPKIQFLAIKVGVNATILRQPGASEIKFVEFPY